MVEEDLVDGGEIGLHTVRGHRALVAHPCEVPCDVDFRDVEGGGGFARIIGTSRSC